MFDETKKRVYLQIGEGGHQLKKKTWGEIGHEETVLYIEKNGIGANKKEIEKLHRVLNHKGVRNMEFAFRNAGRLDLQMIKMIKEVVDGCSICQNNSRLRSKPSVAIQRATDFNSIMTLYLKVMGKKYVSRIVCAFSRMLVRVVLKDKKTETR